VHDLRADLAVDAVCVVPALLNDADAVEEQVPGCRPKHGDVKAVLVDGLDLRVRTYSDSRKVHHLASDSSTGSTTAASTRWVHGRCFIYSHA
jgi:hypothetical protein